MAALNNISQVSQVYYKFVFCIKESHLDSSDLSYISIEQIRFRHLCVFNKPDEIRIFQNKAQALNLSFR